jgi:hypothetical protein
MYQINSLNIPSNPSVGLAENWYVGKKTGIEGIEIDQRVFEHAEGFVKFKGVPLGSSDSYQPTAVGYDTHAFLFDGVYVGIHTVKPASIHQGIKFSFDMPPRAITIISNNQSHLRDVATKLMLPLEKLVELEAVGQ